MTLFLREPWLAVEWKPPPPPLPASLLKMQLVFFPAAAHAPTA